MNTTASVVGWAAEPQGRGTMGLLWSCLTTIFLCTWNAVHPNVPAKDDGPWRILWRRVGYMLIALLAPEYMLVLALAGWTSARLVQAKSPEWSLSQSFFLVMGGFALQEGQKESTYMEIEDMIRLLSNDEITWPDKSSEPDILDRSKADWVLKSLALVQATWFIAQLIGRAVQRLPVTTLELFTLGIISCALPIYAAYWAKPFDVRRPIVVRLRKPLPSDLRTCSRIKLLAIPDLGRQSSIPGVLVVCCTIVFGAIHLIGWHFHFPTELEMWFWRASSIMCVVLPLLIIALTRVENIHLTVPLATVGIYVLCRVYMFVELFVSLRAVQEDVYRTPLWSQYLPSFG